MIQIQEITPRARWPLPLLTAFSATQTHYFWPQVFPLTLQYKTRRWGPPFWVFAPISCVGKKKFFLLLSLWLCCSHSRDNTFPLILSEISIFFLKWFLSNICHSDEKTNTSYREINLLTIGLFSPFPVAVSLSWNLLWSFQTQESAQSLRLLSLSFRTNLSLTTIISYRQPQLKFSPLTKDITNT
jgi:hypothetical protein